MYIGVVINYNDSGKNIVGTQNSLIIKIPIGNSPNCPVSLSDV